MSEAASSPATSAVISDMGAKPELVVDRAVPVPKPTIPSADKIIAGIKAKIAEVNKPVVPGKSQPSVTEPGSTEPAKEFTADPKAALAELAKAQAKVRELSEKVKASEGAATDAGFGKELRELATKDKLAAVAKLFGNDAEEVLADLVTGYYEKQGTTPPGTDPKAGPAPELKMVLDKLELVSKELADIKAGKPSAEQEQAQLAAQEQSVKGYLKSVAEKFKDEFEISSRAENLDEAVAKALSKADGVVKRLGLDPAKLTAEQAEQVAKESFAEAEREFEQLGSRYGKVKEPPRVRAWEKPLSRAPQLQFSKKPDKESFTEYKARINRELGYNK